MAREVVRRRVRVVGSMVAWLGCDDVIVYDERFDDGVWMLMVRA